MVNQLSVQKTAQIETWGNPDAQQVLVVLHGYGQLVKYFIRKFHGLNADDIFVVAPEGLHRFYLRGAGGRVGASWMTKEERETDIQDYINYLNQVCEKLNLNHYKKKTLLGFSQGGATASRWHERGDFLADQFVLWGSVFPPDVKLPEQHAKFMHSDNYFLIGDQDEHYSIDAQKEISDQIIDLNLNFSIIPYQGTHDVYLDELLKLLG